MNNPIQIIKELYIYIKDTFGWLRYSFQNHISLGLSEAFFIHEFYEIRDRCFLGIKPEECEEILTINVRDNDGIFPINEFKVKVYERDKKYRYFHVEGKGWDIVFEPNCGNLIRINQEGDDKKVKKYIIKNVKKWLGENNPSEGRANRKAILSSVKGMY